MFKCQLLIMNERRSERWEISFGIRTSFRPFERFCSVRTLRTAFERPERRSNGRFLQLFLQGIYSWQVTENVNNHIRCYQSKITYKTVLLCQKSHKFLTFLDLTFHKSNNYRSGLIKMYLSLVCMTLNWNIYSVCPTFDVTRSTWTKNKHTFFR